MATAIAQKLALTYQDAAELVGVDYRTIKAGVERGTIPSIQLGARIMIPRAGLLKAFGVEAA
jgi:excisionase family DNA binding protein